jgi:hypothetical protein
MDNMKRIAIAFLLTAATTVSPFLNPVSAAEAKPAGTSLPKTTANQNNANKWSEPVHDLRGRLVVVFEDIRQGARSNIRHRVFLELENVQGGFVPITVARTAVTSQLFDEKGKAVPKDDLPMSGPVLSSQSAVVTPNGYIGLRIDKTTVGVPPRGGGVALLAMPGEGEWLLRPGKYPLKGTLSISKIEGADARQWFGQLELPPVEITVSQRDVDAIVK